MLLPDRRLGSRGHDRGGVVAACFPARRARPSATSERPTLLAQLAVQIFERFRTPIIFQVFL